MTENRSIRRAVAVGAAAALGLGLMGVGAMPAYAVDVADATALNQAILDGESPIVLTNDIVMDVDVEPITYDVEIVGGDYLIDFAGHGGFDISASVTVTDLTVANAQVDAFHLELGSGDIAEFTGVSVYGAGDGGFDVDLDDAQLLLTDVYIDGINGAGVYVEDDSGTSAVTIIGLEVQSAEYGVGIDEFYGTSTFSIYDSTLTDVYYGIRFAAEDQAVITVTSTAILAGPAYNSGGSGYAIYGYLYDDATMDIRGSSVIGDPDGDRFSEGLNTDQYNDTRITVEDAFFYGNGSNLHVHVYGDALFELLGSTVAGAAEYGVYLCEVDGYVVIDETTIEGNGVGNGYPGLYGYLYSGEQDALLVNRSTISGNGVGIELDLLSDGTVATVVNSTISGNNSDGEDWWPAIEVEGSFESLMPQFNLLYSTVTANLNVGAGLELDGVYAWVYNSIVSGNGLIGEHPAEIVAFGDALVDAQWSIIGSVFTDGGTYSEGDGVKVTSDPGVGPLADNGGPTLTHALLSGSVALNSGDPNDAGAPETDQRGEARIQLGRIDIGAVEMSAMLPATGPQSAPWLAVALAMLIAGAGVVVARRFVLH